MGHTLSGTNTPNQSKSTKTTATQAIIRLTNTSNDKQTTLQHLNESESPIEYSASLSTGPEKVGFSSVATGWISVSPLLAYRVLDVVCLVAGGG